jgi:maltose O-acetyltransferase
MNAIRTRLGAVAALPIVPHGTRARVLRAAGMRIDEGAWVSPNTVFTHCRSVIAAGAYIARQCYFEDHSPVTVGRNVHIAPGCRLLTATHAIGGPDCRAGAWSCEPITIGDGSWLGGSVTVLPGVTIGNGCVVAAGSVVTRDCEPNGLYAGVPATRKRDLP